MESHFPPEELELVELVEELEDVDEVLDGEPEDPPPPELQPVAQQHKTKTANVNLCSNNVINILLDQRKE